MIMPEERRPPGPRMRRRVRLWPLLFLPIIGLATGYYAAVRRVTPPFRQAPLSLPEGVAFGTLAGCSLTIAVASTVLAYRIAQARFTIGALVLTIATAAVLLWLARSIVP